MSNGKPETDWIAKGCVAKESFKEVLASDEHEDSKAQRILTAMAFLTAAAGVIFAELRRSQIGAFLTFPLLASHDYLGVCFFAFVTTIVIGTLCVLAALGPAFNIPPSWRKKDRESYPRSLLFSQLILQGTQADWERHWQDSTADELRTQLVKNYAIEAYLLAKKIRFKVGMMRRGKAAYKLSLGFLGMLVIPIVTTSVDHVNSLAAWIFALVLVQDLVEQATSPPTWDWRVRGRGKLVIRPKDLLSLSLLYILARCGLATSLIIVGIISWRG